MSSSKVSKLPNLSQLVAHAWDVRNRDLPQWGWKEGFIYKVDIDNLSAIWKKASSLGATLFIWEKESLTLSLTQSRVQRAKHFIGLVSTVAYALYLLVASVWLAVIKKRPLNEYLQVVLVFVFTSIMVLMYSVILWKRDDFLLFVSHYFSFATFLSDRYLLRKRQNKIEVRRVTIYVAALWPLVKCWGVLIFLFCNLRPTAPFFPAALVQDSLLIVIAYPLQGVLGPIYAVVTGAALTSSIATVTVSAFFFLCAFPELRIEKKSYRTKKILRTASNITHFVRCTTLIFDQLNSWSKYIVVPSQIMVTRSIQISVFVLVRYHKEINLINQIGLIMYITTFGGGLLILLAMAGEAHKVSIKTMQTFGRLPLTLRMSKKETVEWRHLRRSFKPMAVKAGNFYVLKRKSVMKAALDYIRGSVRLLFGLQKKADKLSQ